MTKRRITSAVLALVMAMSSTYSLALAQESEAVYTYSNENGETITITQEQLDSEHWNVDALGDTLPIIYEKFPMRIDTFVNDLAEVSLDIEYMKKIEDMDSVTLRITDVATGTDIYNDEITNYSFYSPNLESGKQYEMHLIEVLNGETTDYGKAVSINKVSSQINEVADFSNAEDDTKILVGDTDALRAGMSTDEDGKLVINTAVAQYERVAVGDFYDYIDTMPQNKTYRLYMIDGDEQYEGFISTTSRREIYTYEASVVDLVAPCANSDIITTLDNLTYSQLKSTELLELTDASFQIFNSSNATNAYKLYEVTIPETAIAKHIEDRDVDSGFRIKITGDSQIKVRNWINKSGTVTFEQDRTSTNNNLTYTYYISQFDIPDTGGYVYLYFMVYFPQTLTGTGTINYFVKDDIGYTDDQVGSVYEIYNDANAPATLANTEYTLTDSRDIDSFKVYTGEANKVYKIEIKNRSLADQASLESGIYVNKGHEKRVVGWQFNSTGNLWYEWSVYTVPKNQDTVIYKPANDYPHVISIGHKPNSSYDAAEAYQLSYQLLTASAE